jgi:mercuric ion binding protein
MQRYATLVVLAAALSVGAPAWAASQTVKTVTLSVPSMYCPACPIKIRQALTRVAGVHDVTASFAQRTAVVRFDGSRTSVEQLKQALRDAGHTAVVQAAGR